MNKIITLILVFIFTKTIYCQNNKVLVYMDCEIINGDTVNCQSNDSIKNGYWVYYKVGIHGHSDYSKPEDYVEFKDYLYLISEGQYKNNKKNGLWKFYSKYRTYETQYIANTVYFNQDGQKDCVEVEYYGKDRVKSRTFWDNGEIDSLKVFYETGIVKCIGLHKDGILDKFKIYYPNGKLKYVGREIADYRVLNLIYYNSEGEEAPLRDKELSSIAMIEGLMNYLEWAPR